MFFIVFRLFQDEVEEMAYVVSEKKCLCRQILAEFPPSKNSLGKLVIIVDVALKTLQITLSNNSNSRCQQFFGKGQCFFGQPFLNIFRFLNNFCGTRCFNLLISMARLQNFGVCSVHKFLDSVKILLG